MCLLIVATSYLELLYVWHDDSNGDLGLLEVVSGADICVTWLCRMLCLSYVYQSRTMFMSHTLSTWGIWTWCMCDVTLSNAVFKLCISVTNCVHESRTMYIGYLELICVWRDSVECSDGFNSCICVTNYMYMSHELCTWGFWTRFMCDMTLSITVMCLSYVFASRTTYMSRELCTWDVTLSNTVMCSSYILASRTMYMSHELCTWGIWTWYLCDVTLSNAVMGLTHAFASRTMYMSHELCTWGIWTRFMCDATLSNALFKLCFCVTNYIHESRTMYMGYLELIYVWRDSVECCV